MIRLGKRTSFANALIVLSGVAAHDSLLFHLNTEVLFNKIDGGDDR